MKKLMKRFLFSRVTRYTILYWIRCWDMLIYEEDLRNFWNQNFLYCVPQELVAVLCPTPSSVYPVNSRSILSLNTEEHHCYICIYIYIYIHTCVCVCVCVCLCSRACNLFQLESHLINFFETQHENCGITGNLAAVILNFLHSVNWRTREFMRHETATCATSRYDALCTNIT